MSPSALTPRHILPRLFRLRTRRDFRRVYQRGSRARGDHLIVVAFRRRSPGMRLGLSVSKANGRAIRRNKIKRVFREAFRLERPQLPGNFDLVLIPQPQPRYELAAVRLELVQLVTQLHRRRHRHGRASQRSRRSR